MTGQIIFLHGASSSGKSTIARALQSRIDRPFWHISIDHLRDSGVLPMARYRSGEFDWKASRQAFFDGFHRSLAAYAGAGNDLIVEHILDTAGWADDLQALLAPHDVFFVGVHCQPQTLARREKDRGDRAGGSALTDFQTIHVGRRYDLELDGEDDVDDNVLRLLDAWRGGRRISEFAPQ